MSTPEFILWSLWGMVSPWMLLPLFLFLVWAVFAIRIGKRHHVSMEDIPDRAAEEEMLEKEEWIR